jgi:hypothetical protein
MERLTGCVKSPLGVDGLRPTAELSSESQTPHGRSLRHAAKPGDGPKPFRHARDHREKCPNNTHWLASRGFRANGRNLSPADFSGP